MSAEQSKNTRIKINHFGQRRRAGGTTIAAIQGRLFELNQQFPDERRKPATDRDPDYVLQRSKITETLGFLTARQRCARKNIRELI